MFSSHAEDEIGTGDVPFEQVPGTVTRGVCSVPSSQCLRLSRHGLPVLGHGAGTLDADVLETGSCQPRPQVLLRDRRTTYVPGADRQDAKSGGSGRSVEAERHAQRDLTCVLGVALGISLGPSTLSWSMP